MKKRSLGILASLVGIFGSGAVAACGGTHGAASGPHAPRVAAASAPNAGNTTCRVGVASLAEPLSRTGSGSTLQLARIRGQKVAFVADEDAKALLTVDVETRTEIAETKLAGAPSQVYVASDGRVFVTLRDTSELVVLTAKGAAEPLTQACTTKTPSEPIAIAARADDSLIVVTSGWGQELSAYDGKSLARRFETKLPREPRAVVLADDGKTAFVSHAVGAQLSVVDLEGSTHGAKEISLRGFNSDEMRELVSAATNEKPKGLPSCQGFALAKAAAVPGRIFAPAVVVDPGDPEARPDGYGKENEETESQSVAVLDEGKQDVIATSTSLGRQRFLPRRGMQRDPRDQRPACLLPRAAAIDPKTKSLLVTCYGIDAVVAYDAASVNPSSAELRRWTVGSGPSGIVIDAEKHRAVVWSQFDRTIATFPIGGSELADDKTTPPVVQRTAMTPLANKLPAEYQLGRILFHAAGDARIAADGRACASCHPDGRDDAITWATPEGPRRSIMLAGRTSRTAPYSWNGTEHTLHNHLGSTFDRLSGKGLRSIELDALVAYLSGMPAPASAEVTSADQAKVDRGRAIFGSAEAGCASCHSGADYTDGKNHDIGSKQKFDREAAFNTPSLHLVGGTGPYFHDGRYNSLGELLTKSDGKMGRTAQLSHDDLDALETFLRTL